MKKETGGPAFPTVENWRVDSGMTLRDYFAANAPITIKDAMLACGVAENSFGMLSTASRIEVLFVLATMRGEYADAMIAERAK